MTATAKNVHQRLAAAMAEVDYIQKERKQGMNYTIVSHDAVTAKVRPVLLKNGIVYYPVRCEHLHNGNRAECSLTVRFVNIDEPSDFFDVPTFGYGIDTQDKGPGKAMSYAVKYALLKALGLETGDDPDTESVEFLPNEQDGRGFPARIKDGRSTPSGTPAPKSVSSAEQKRGLEAIDADLLDCATVADVDKCAKIWASIMNRDGWSKDYRDIAAPKFQARRNVIVTNDEIPDFPGDRPNGAVANMMAGE